MVRREDGRSAQLKEKVRLTEGEILNCPLSGFKALRPTGDVLALRPACGRWRPRSTCSPPCVAAERRPRPRPSRPGLGACAAQPNPGLVERMAPGCPPQGQKRRTEQSFGDGVLPLDQLRLHLARRHRKVAHGAIASGHYFAKGGFWEVPILQQHCPALQSQRPASVQCSGP